MSDEITRKIEFGTYEPESKKTRVEYTKELLDQAAYLTLEDEKEIVKMLAKHYDGSIQIAVIIRKIVDKTAFLQLLACRDEKDYIKTRKVIAPIFNGEIWERPVRFLKHLHLYLNPSEITLAEMKYTLSTSLKGKAASWWYMAEHSVQLFEDFERQFRARYWNSDVTDRIKRKIKYGVYKPKGKRRELNMLPSSSARLLI